VKDGPKFFKLLKKVSRVKPVILWKGGLTRGGARAVHSHTASIGGEKEIWDTVFKQSGAIRVNSLDELLDTTLAFLHLPPIKERRVCVVGGGGGIGVAAADDCERAGLSVPLFSTELQEKLRTIVPPAGGSARNPVDVGSPFPPPVMLGGVLETVIAGGNVDMIIIDELELARTDLMASSGQKGQDDFGEVARIPVTTKEKYGKPIIAVLPVESIGSDVLEYEGARRKLSDFYLEKGIPVFLTLERAVKALSNFVGYYETRDAL
jgi:acyl-CoA synthetase (NDP forming)